jgi:hypothetical protein
VILSLAAACGGDSAEPTSDGSSGDIGSSGDSGDEAYVAIGTGFPSYIPVSDGDTLPIIEGIQGGFHLWGGFEVSGLEPIGLTIEFDLEWNGESIGGASYTDELSGDSNPFDYGGVAIIFSDNELPTQVSGQTVTVSVRLEDTAGVVVSNSVEVIPECCSF